MRRALLCGLALCALCFGLAYAQQSEVMRNDSLATSMKMGVSSAIVLGMVWTLVLLFALYLVWRNRWRPAIRTQSYQKEDEERNARRSTTKLEPVLSEFLEPVHPKACIDALRTLVRQAGIDPAWIKAVLFGLLCPNCPSGPSVVGVHVDKKPPEGVELDDELRMETPAHLFRVEVEIPASGEKAGSRRFLYFLPSGHRLGDSEEISEPNSEADFHPSDFYHFLVRWSAGLAQGMESVVSYEYSLTAHYDSSGHFVTESDPAPVGDLQRVADPVTSQGHNVVITVVETTGGSEPVRKEATVSMVGTPRQIIFRADEGVVELRPGKSSDRQVEPGTEA